MKLLWRGEGGRVKKGESDSIKRLRGRDGKLGGGGHPGNAAVFRLRPLWGCPARNRLPSAHALGYFLPPMVGLDGSAQTPGDSREAVAAGREAGPWTFYV